jgi:secreted Zn-dependent insulinase-like peptidase
MDVSDAQLFEVGADLTELGLQHRTEVVRMIFAAVDLLQQQVQSQELCEDQWLVDNRTSSSCNTDSGSSTSISSSGGGGGLPSYLEEEMVSLSRISFDYAEKAHPSNYASHVASCMQRYWDPRTYLSGPQLLVPSQTTPFTPSTSSASSTSAPSASSPDSSSSSSPGAVADYLRHLQPGAAHVMVVAPEFSGTTARTAAYYGTQYNVVSYDEHSSPFANVRAQDYPELKLPTKNKFVPENFTLVTSNETEAIPGDFQQSFQADSKVAADDRNSFLMRPPQLIHKDEKWALWHKVDESFQQPKVHIVVSLAVNQDVYDATFVVNGRLFSGCFLESINEFLYEARMGGLTLDFDVTSRGIQLVLSGFSDKMPLFVQQVCAELLTFVPDDAVYSRLVQALQRELSSWPTQQPYYHASYYTSLATESLQYTVPELTAAVAKSSVSKIHGFLPDILQYSQGTALVVGNMQADEARALVQTIQTAFPFSPFTSSMQGSKRQYVKFPRSPVGTAGYRAAHPGPNPKDDNSAVSFVFQLPTRNPSWYMLVELLAEVLEQPFYTALRTEQQLGYIVQSGARNRDGIRGISFVVQSSVVDGEELTRRVEQFLAATVPAVLGGLTEEVLLAFQEGVAVRKLEPDQRLSSQAGRFWSEIIAATSTAPAAPAAAASAVAVTVGVGTGVSAAEFHATATPTPTGDTASLEEMWHILDDYHEEPAQEDCATSTVPSKLPPMTVPTPLFDRRVQEARAVRAITLPQLREFAHQFLSASSAQRRLVISQITASNSASSTSSTSSTSNSASSNNSGSAAVCDENAQSQPAILPCSLSYVEISGKETDFKVNEKFV